jgi:hypothetical protein
MLCCYGTWFSFQAMVLIFNPPPELGVDRVLDWNDAVAELYLEFAQLLKPFAPNSSICIPDKFNTIELSNTLRCHVTWLLFLM